MDGKELGSRLLPPAFLGSVVGQVLHFPKTGAVPRHFLRPPADPEAGEGEALVAIAGSAHRGDVVNHILAERTVREPEGVKSGLRRSADGSGQVGVDGDDAVAW